MGYFSTGSSEVFRRVIAPPFVAAWASLRNLTGRRGRQKAKVGRATDAAAKRRDVAMWNESHGR